MNLPSVAVVILNYNGKKFLQQFLPSVLATTYPNGKIIVADNASTDNSIEFIQKHFINIEVIKLPKNYGYAGGYNEALKFVNADYFVLLNSDVEVEKNWIEPVIQEMENDSLVAACQPKIRSFHNKKMFEYAGAAGGWLDNLGYPFARGRVFDTCEEDKGQYDDTKEIFWASGAAMFIRASSFREAGGFDASFFAHMEEIDLCWRLQLSGYKILYCGRSIVYHVGGGTLPKNNYRKVFLNFRNNLLMMMKNLPYHEKWYKIFARILLDWLFAFKSLLSGKFNDFKAVLHAHAEVIKWKQKNLNKNSFTNKKFTSLTGVTSKLIIWQYFLKNKKRFSQIVDENAA